MNTEYTILNSLDSQAIELWVNDLLSKGWELYGDLQVTYQVNSPPASRLRYTQAMIRVTTSDYARTSLPEPNKTIPIRKP